MIIALRQSQFEPLEGEKFRLGVPGRIAPEKGVPAAKIATAGEIHLRPRELEIERVRFPGEHALARFRGFAVVFRGKVICSRQIPKNDRVVRIDRARFLQITSGRFPITLPPRDQGHEIRNVRLVRQNPLRQRQLRLRRFVITLSPVENNSAGQMYLARLRLQARRLFQGAPGRFQSLRSVVLIRPVGKHMDAREQTEGRNKIRLALDRFVEQTNLLFRSLFRAQASSVSDLACTQINFVGGNIRGRLLPNGGVLDGR